ncbi:hypothetical protein B0A49_08719 [Cryomyces minteri]|uniref:Autophagy protein n=1 Tax=Cryomyces minteri TaxID=331657 RepID=A0A4U0X023_9PEZI|nr:hypothetical protein B0A49_08719 [Cryomyces minteri]
MGWFWGSSTAGASTTSTQDPYDKLDPALRKFLEKESPVKYTSSTPSKQIPPREPQSYRSQVSELGQSTAPPKTEVPPESEPLVPKASLFQDGRHADIWKTYQPLEAVEASGKSDQDKLLDVIDAYNARKAEIGRAALENCAFEQMAISECLKNGGAYSRMTMCSAETRKLERCYVMQTKFLKALGYLAPGRSQEEEEAVQMHADMLYQRMMEQDKLIQEAREKGEPIPEFKPVMSAIAGTVVAAPASTQPAMTTPTSSIAFAHNAPTPPTPARQPQSQMASQSSIFSHLPEDKQKQIAEKLAKLSPDERKLEEDAIAADLAAGRHYLKQVSSVYDEERKRRIERKEQGYETLGDAIKRWWGW